MNCIFFVTFMKYVASFIVQLYKARTKKHKENHTEMYSLEFQDIIYRTQLNTY